MPSIPEPKIVRSHRSSIQLSISKEGELVVKAPYLAPKFVIMQFVNSKIDWIEKTMEKVQKRIPKKRVYEEGEEFLYLGGVYKLKFYNGLKIVPKEGVLYFPKALEFRIQKELHIWYEKQAADIISKRVEYHSEKMNAMYKDIFFSDTSSKWGTCFADNRLQFNWRLVMTPLMILDYVVIHELTHTTEKHHQDSFWRRVRQFTPAYRQHRKWLEENAGLLHF